MFESFFFEDGFGLVPAGAAVLRLWSAGFVPRLIVRVIWGSEPALKTVPSAIDCEITRSLVWVVSYFFLMQILMEGSNARIFFFAFFCDNPVTLSIVRRAGTVEAGEEIGAGVLLFTATDTEAGNVEVVSGAEDPRKAYRSPPAVRTAAQSEISAIRERR